MLSRKLILTLIENVTCTMYVIRAGSVASGSGGEELDEWEVEANVAMTEYR